MRVTLSRHCSRWVTGVALLCLLGGCARSASQDMAGELQGTLQIKGSDTMVNLVQAWAEAFMERHPAVLISVTGGGSGTGIASLFNGTADIASCSRTMSETEIAQARARGWIPQEFTVALDGLAVVVHPDHPVERLTLAQLADIFTGTITQWQAVGGVPAPIVLLSREVNSGTHVYFKEHVVRRGNVKGTEEFAPSALLLPSSQAIADEVAHNRQAIGYYGMGYLSPRQKAIAVAQTVSQPYVPPTIDAVRNGTYPIARPLFFYTRGDHSELMQLFLEFVLSPDGQRIVPEQDFVPLR